MVRDPALRREAIVAVAWPRGRRARRCSASPRPGLPGPAGNRETFAWLAEGGRAGAVADLEAAALRGGAVKASVLTHRRADDTAHALAALLAAARRAGAVANRALKRGYDQDVPDELRGFFFLPFMHSEDSSIRNAACSSIARRRAPT